MTNQFFSTLISGAEKLNISLTREQAEKLFDFYEIVLDYNKKTNLTAITDETGFIEKHILDSLTGAEYLPPSASVCDIGAGAGFPSIPLKIYRDDLSFVLFDALKKRVTFLSYAIDFLGLSGTSAVHMRAEDAARKYRAGFDAATARAVGATSLLLEYSIPLIRRGGVFISYKGPDISDIGTAENALTKLNATVVGVFPLSLPFSGAVRNLAVFTKTGDTPLIYPRHGSAISKSPL